MSAGGLNASGLRSFPNPCEDAVTLAFLDRELEQLEVDEFAGRVAVR